MIEGNLPRQVVFHVSSCCCYFLEAVPDLQNSAFNLSFNHSISLKLTFSGYIFVSYHEVSYFDY